MVAELAVPGARPKVVNLRLAAVDEYVRGLDPLDELINTDLAAGASEAAGVIRNLIETVTILLTPPEGRHELGSPGSLDALGLIHSRNVLTSGELAVPDGPSCSNRVPG